MHKLAYLVLKSISKTKFVKFFCPCMIEHMIYIKMVTNVTQTLHQNVTNITKQNIASKVIPNDKISYDEQTKYMK